MTDIENELLAATNLNPKKYKDRAKMLAALIRAVQALDQDDYDDLTDEAVEWANAGVEALNRGRDVAEFEDPEAAEAAQDAEPILDDDPSDSGDAGTPDVDTDDGPDDDASDDTDDEAEDLEPQEPVQNPERHLDIIEPDDAEAEPEPPKAAKPKKPKKAPTPTRYDNLPGTKNRYGYYEGTLADETIKLLEKGVTMREIKDTTGQTRYNLVKALIGGGHLVEKYPTGVYKLTHKDGATASQAPAAKPKKVAKAKDK